MDMYAKWMKASYIKYKVYDRSSVSEARLMCFSYTVEPVLSGHPRGMAK